MKNLICRCNTNITQNLKCNNNFNFLCIFGYVKVHRLDKVIEEGMITNKINENKKQKNLKKN